MKWRIVFARTAEKELASFQVRLGSEWDAQSVPWSMIRFPHRQNG